MSNMLVVKPLAIAAIAASNGTGTANLLTPDPKEVWQAGAVTTTTFDIDLPASTMVDTVFLGFTNAAGGARWSITGGAAYGSATLFEAAPMAAATLYDDDRVHAFARFAAADVAKLRITATQTGGDALQLGVLVLGLAFQPVWNRELGAGRVAIDTGSAEPLTSGGFGVGEGVVKDGYQWTFGDLSDIEIAQLYGLVRSRGTTRPVLVVEDPEDAIALGDGLHFGLFTKLEKYERNDAAKTRWNLAMEDAA